MTVFPKGLHHITAIAADAQRNINFYTGVLSLHMVKFTVNHDDPSAYHLYYGDKLGTPGSALTFFVWPHLEQGVAGTGQVTEITFSIPTGALAFWKERLAAFKIAAVDEKETGRPGLRFTDPDGIALALVERDTDTKFKYWPGSGVPETYAIAGFNGVDISLQEAQESILILENALGFTKDITVPELSIETFKSGNQYANIHTAPDMMPGRMGTGTVHHVAWNVADDAEEMAVRVNLMKAGLYPTPQIDRRYFHSVYAREPGGVLYELATQGPGFAVDEPEDKLGQTLVLPDHFEAHRERIVAMLPPIILPKSA